MNLGIDWNCCICKEPPKQFLQSHVPYFYCPNCFHVQKQKVSSDVNRSFESSICEQIEKLIETLDEHHLQISKILVCHCSQESKYNVTSNSFEITVCPFDQLSNITTSESFDVIIDFYTLNAVSTPNLQMESFHSLSHSQSLIYLYCYKSQNIIQQNYRTVDDYFSLFSINSMKVLSHNNFLTIISLKETKDTYWFTLQKISSFSELQNRQDVIRTFVEEMWNKVYDDTTYANANYKMQIYKNMLCNIILKHRLNHKKIVSVGIPHRFDILHFLGLNEYIDIKVENSSYLPDAELDNCCIILLHSVIDTKEEWKQKIYGKNSVLVDVTFTNQEIE